MSELNESGISADYQFDLIDEQSLSFQMKVDRSSELAKYIALGVSVIPIRPKSKIPAIGWIEFQSRYPTQEELTTWGKDFPNMNVGIVTGALSALVVLDVDGPEALASLKSYGEMPETPTSVTGKGTHYYFRHPGFDVPNRVGILPKVDIRGDGGYVVAPPSVHENGKTYAWKRSPVDVRPADLPAWLLKLIQGDHSGATESEQRSPIMSRKTRQEVDRILGELSRAPKGQRNDRLNKAAFELGQLVGDETLNREWSLKHLAGVARTELHPVPKTPS